MTNFPTSLDSFTNPNPTDLMNASGVQHDVQHANLNDAVAALQAKLGVNGSNVSTTIDYLVTKLVAAILNSSANFRFKDGQLQFWDATANTNDPTRPWRALGVNNGQTVWSAPIAN
jgi:hypothetical protein